MTSYRVAWHVLVVDLFERDDLRGQEVPQLCQEDPIAEPLLQLRGRGQLLIDTRLDPPEKATL